VLIKKPTTTTRMGSRLSNTSWCWSPRVRCPEHTPPIKQKTFVEHMEEELDKKWWSENRWLFVEGKVYDHTDNDWKN